MCAGWALTKRLTRKHFSALLSIAKCSTKAIVDTVLHSYSESTQICAAPRMELELTRFSGQYRV
jgi:hypothetical protein